MQDYYPLRTSKTLHPSNTSLFLKEQILALELADGDVSIIKKQDGLRLIVSYSAKRAKRDKRNRERGLKRLEKNLNKGKLTKSHINNRGYNKYLKLEGDIKIEIDYEKFEADDEWDGLKGYVTNTRLSAKNVIQNYNQLWHIERAFRISETDQCEVIPFEWTDEQEMVGKII